MPDSSDMDHAVTETSAGFQTLSNRLLTLALTQHSTHDFLRETLSEALRISRGRRAFLARIEQESGELVVVETAGEGWTRRNRKLRLEPHNETQRGITGYVAITGEPYCSPDVNLDPHHLRIFDDARSEMAVPYFDTEGRVRGVLNIDSDCINRFSHEDVARVTTLANGIATALALEEFRSRERLLVDIGLDLAAITEIEPLANRVVDVAAKALQCEGCSVFLIDENTQMLVLQASRSALANRIGEIAYHLGEGLTGSVALTGETVRLDDPREDPRWEGLYPEFSPVENSAYLAAPVPGRERILGVIRVSRPRSRTAWFRAHFTESDERMLKTIGGQFGIAVENVRSFNRSLHTERMAAWGELSAKSAHMIGNRTFAIKGDINELKHLISSATSEGESTGDGNNAELCRHVGDLTSSIERGVYRLEEILREFRDFVMATQLKLTNVDANLLVAEAVRETFPQRSAVELKESYSKNLPTARYDGGKLKRALSELIENAISFMPEGGILKVSTGLIAPGEGTVEAGLSPGRGYAKIVVEDNGPGVPADIKSQIFNPFFSSRVKGMGLGLSIVKGIIDAHRGIIRETGSVGSGARFEIYLPI